MYHGLWFLYNHVTLKNRATMLKIQFDIIRIKYTLQYIQIENILNCNYMLYISELIKEILNDSVY